MNKHRLNVNLTNYGKVENGDLPYCPDCKDWPWCAEIPQTCPKEKENINGEFENSTNLA